MIKNGKTVEPEESSIKNKVKIKKIFKKSRVRDFFSKYFNCKITTISIVKGSLN
jgi:hypothetical protein|tara:strand:- start:122 stop:283 length:162 start_codon:yes stop_codon:yes gene_type:complete